jgi:hypothetical protein
MRIETSVVVNRPIDEVRKFLADFFHVPRYGKATLGVRQTSPGPPASRATSRGPSFQAPRRPGAPPRARNGE